MRRAVAFVAVLTTVLTLLAPGIVSAEPPFDPAQAEEIARRILPAPSDLPGTGWTVTSTSNTAPDGSNVSYPDTPACNNGLGYWAKAAGKHKDGTVAGLAIEGLSKPGAGGLFALPSQAELVVEIHEDDENLGYAIDNTRDIFDSPDFSKCLGDLFGRTAGGAAKVSVMEATPGAAVPNGGIAKAVELKLGNELISLSMRMEFYVWVYGNAVAEASVFGPPSGLAGVPEAIVAGMQAGLQREATR